MTPTRTSAAGRRVTWAAAAAMAAACGAPQGLEMDAQGHLRAAAHDRQRAGDGPAGAAPHGAHGAAVAADGADLHDPFDVASDDTLDLGVPPEPVADDHELPPELALHSGLDDLLVVMHSQAEHLRMSGEVVLGRAEGEDPEEAATVPPYLAELARQAQEAADSLTGAVAEVAEARELYIPAGAVSANHAVVEGLARCDAQRFGDLYVEQQCGTLKRARQTLKHALKLNPRYVRAFERAAARLNHAFEIFDFVQQNAAQAANDPVGAVRFGAGLVDRADNLFDGEEDSSRGGSRAADREAEADDVELAAVRAAREAAARGERGGRRGPFRVRFAAGESADGDTPATPRGDPASRPTPFGSL